MKILFIGELNPYGPREDCALLDDPVGSAGWRLRAAVCALRSATYRSEAIGRVNLCDGAWSLRQARKRRAELLRAIPEAVPMVLLGAKVRDAFYVPAADGTFFVYKTIMASSARRYVTLPHPSGLCRLWHEPGAFERARALLREVAPDVPWGEAIDGRADG